MEEVDNDNTTKLVESDECVKIGFASTLGLKSREVYGKLQTKYVESEKAQALQKRAKEVAMEAKAKGTDFAKIAYTKGRAYSKVAQAKYDSIPEPKRRIYVRLFLSVVFIFLSIHMFTRHLSRHKHEMMLMDELDGIDHEVAHAARENQQPLLRKQEKKDEKKKKKGKK